MIFFTDYVVNVENSVGMWTIDPIDGTKGFLRGEQYAVCLSLIVDSKVQVGVIGCPNLPVDPTHPEKGTGCIFTAVRGQGAQQVTQLSFIIRRECLELIHLFLFLAVDIVWRESHPIGHPEIHPRFP